MKRVHGYVLDKQTSRGIANLVVTAYDCEVAIAELAHDLEKHHDGGDGLARFGHRIASVLTADDGRFELAEDNLGRKSHEHTNLLIVVFAPEDIEDPARPVPLPPHRRVLYMSALPRHHAGAEEAYVIRLSPAQLERFGITTDGKPALPARGATSVDYARSLEHAYAFKDTVKAVLAPRVKAHLHDAEELRTRSKVKFQRLTAIPKHDLEHPQRLTDRANLPELLKKTISVGLPSLNANARPLRVLLDARDLEVLGLAADANGNIEGTVNPRAFAAHLASKIGGVDLVARRRVTERALALLADASADRGDD